MHPLNFNGRPRTAARLALTLALGGTLHGTGSLAHSGDDEQEAAHTAAQALASQGAAGPAREPGPHLAPARDWDAALGFVVAHAPPYAGAPDRQTRITPAFYLRWGRVSLASRSGLVTRSPDPNQGSGFRVDLSPNDTLRINLGLRYDLGRQESSAQELRGMGDVPGSLRTRLIVSRDLGEGWSLGGTLNMPITGQTGMAADLGLGKRMRLGERTTLGGGVALNWSSARHMQTYFGVNVAQAAATGYAAYEPSAGFRDVTASVTGRTTLDGPWLTFYGAHFSRLVAGAAASPIAFHRNAWGMHWGAGYRF